MTKYQHYKGGIYTLIDTSVLHTETGDFLVVYQNEKGAMYARPRDIFFEKVEVNGEMVPRFKKLHPPYGVIKVDSVRDYKGVTIIPITERDKQRDREMIKEYIRMHPESTGISEHKRGNLSKWIAGLKATE